MSMTVATVLADQWSKRLAERALSGSSASGHWVRVRCVLHRKNSYSFGRTRAALVFLWCFSAACVLTLYASHPHFASPLATSGLGAALGGAAGNLTDILRRRVVVDFIDLSWWPVFNLADVAIVGGLALTCWPS